SKTRLTPQSTVPNWLTYKDVGRSSVAYDVLNAVAKLSFGSGAVCTGVLVAHRRMLTNYHCLTKSTKFAITEAPTKCGAAAALFDFNDEYDKSTVVSAICSKVLGFNESLDFALLSFDTIPLLANRVARTPLKLADTVPAITEDVLVVHPPLGLAKKI